MALITGLTALLWAAGAAAQEPGHRKLPLSSLSTPGYQPTKKPSSGGCRDDESWTYNAGDKGEKGCAHVASEPDKVVKRCVNRKSDDGVWAYEACPKTCGTCGNAPTVKPTGYAPTYKPTSQERCRDDDDWLYNAGDKGEKGCDHIASEPDKVVKRCVNRQSDDGVWAYEACPKTCGTCGTVEYKNWGMQRGWCYSELNDDVGVAKSVGECWDMCEAEYGQSLVAIDLDDYCYCQTDCQCLDDVEEDPTYLVATRRSITELPQEC